MTTDVFRHLDDALDGIARTGIVHAGAHKGQEVRDYRAARFRQITLIEPNPALWPALDRLGVTIHRCAAGLPGVATLHVTEWDERSSTLTPVDYPVATTLQVEVRAMSDLQQGCNVAVLDVQGAELEVLKSADLDRLDAVIVETSAVPRYHGAATRSDIAAYLIAAGWRHSSNWGGHSAGIIDEVWRHPTCV